MSSPARRKLKAEVDDRLDRALEDSFPASDPVAFIDPLPVKPGDRKLPTVEAGRASTRPAGKRKATRA